MKGRPSPGKVGEMKMKPKVIGMIPSRYASTRLPGKPLKMILGKTMIQRVYERCQLAKTLDIVAVATDDDRIAEVVRGFGGTAIMTSPECPSGTDRLAEALQAPGSPGKDADIVVNIQGDQPFIDPTMIEEGVAPLLADPTLPMATLMHPIHRPEDLQDPAVVKVVVSLEGMALYFSRSLIPYAQKPVEHPVYEHVGLYVYRKDFLLKLAKLPPTLLERVESLEQLRVLEHGYRLRVVETRCVDDAFSGFSVDTPDDLVRAESMLKERGKL